MKGAKSLCSPSSASDESHFSFTAAMTCPQCPLSNRSMCARLYKCAVMCESNPFTVCDCPWSFEIFAVVFVCERSYVLKSCIYFCLVIVVVISAYTRKRKRKSSKVTRTLASFFFCQSDVMAVKLQMFFTALSLLC